MSLASGFLDVSKKFSGLRSRWITFMEWQWLTTLTMVRMSSAAAFSLTWPFSAMRSNSSPPSQHSSTRWM